MSASWRVHVSTWLRFFTGNRLAPYHPMPSDAVRSVFSLMSCQPSDTLVDLGCGDGQLLIRAASKPYNVQKCIGYELNSELYNICQQRIVELNLSTTVHVYNTNAVHADLSHATIIVLYLSEQGNKALLPILIPKLQQQPLTRVISFLFPIPSLHPVHTTSVSGGIPILMYNGQSINTNAQNIK